MSLTRFSSKVKQCSRSSLNPLPFLPPEEKGRVHNSSIRRLPLAPCGDQGVRGKTKHDRRKTYSSHLLFLALLALFALSACATDPMGSDGPRLLEEVALEATTPAPTRILSPTPSREGGAAEPTPITMMSELLSPLEVVTIEADFVVITPTLPPSKTPTVTPSNTSTPTITPTPSLTATSTLTQPAFPTSVIIPVTAPVINPIDELCDTQWEYIQPPPDGCPLAPPTVGQGVYQTFERGHMIWVGPWQAIYVLFDDGSAPFWTRYHDSFDENIHPWEDPGLNDSPERPPNTWQPWRGFGKLWRESPREQIYSRVGWATMEREQPFSVRVQMRSDGTLFVNDSNGRVFQLTPGGTWTMYASFPF